MNAFTRANFRSTMTAILILFLFSAAMAGLYLIFGKIDDTNKTRLLLEASKSLLQLGVIVILGGLAASMLKTFEQERVNSKAIHDFHMEFLTELRSNYETAKTVRRMLRASGLTDAESPITLNKDQVNDYRDGMLSLNECQLKLERMKLELGNFPDAFKQSVELFANITTMEKYVRRIHKEFEENWSTFRVEPAKVQFPSLTVLRDFTGPYGDGKFRTELAEQYDSALALIRQELLPFKVAKSAR